MRSKPTRIKVNDLMQRGYEYLLTKPADKDFAPGFKPELTPKQLLRLGVFGGRYMTDRAAEFPDDWFAIAKLCPDRHDPELNSLESTPPSRSQFGARRDGSIK